MDQTSVTLTSLLVAAVLIIFTWCYWYVNRAFNFFKSRGIPGPAPTFPFGTWYASDGAFLGDVDIAHIAKYGPLVATYDGLKANLVVFDQDVIKKVLLASPEKFQDKRAYLSGKNSTLRDVFKILSNEDIKEVNAYLASSMTDKKLKKLAARIESCTNSFVSTFLKSIENKTIVPNGSVHDFVLDITASLLLGVELNADPVFRQGFVKKMKELYDVSKALPPITPLPVSLGTDISNSWIIENRTLQYFKKIILEKISEKSSAEISSEGKSADMLDILLEAADEEFKMVAKERAHDHEKIEDETLLLTTSEIANQVMATILVFGHWFKSTLIFSLQVLASYPEIQEKLWVEISKIKVVEKLTYETIQHLPYLDMFLWEVLRLHPTEFRLERVAKEEVTLSENLTLPGGAYISIPLYALHKSSDKFPEPTVFNPEHFSEDKMAAMNQLTYFPFGQSGSQSPNFVYHVSILQVKWAILKLVSKAKFTLSEGETAPKFKAGIAGVPLPECVTLRVEPRG